MTRFKELQRIENAIKHQNQADLKWALAYCKMRLQTANRKDHEKYWRGIQKKVQSAIEADN